MVIFSHRYLDSGSINVKTCVYLASSVASFLVLGGGGGKAPKCTDKKTHVLTMRERAPPKQIFLGLKIHPHKLQSMQFPLITYDMAL